MLADRALTLTELAGRVGVSIVNRFVLKNNHAKAVRFSTLTAICDALECDVGDILGVRP
jgi:putative transcriptional regulator